MQYEIWDTESANLVGAFLTREAALNLLRRWITFHGPEYVATFSLNTVEDATRTVEVIAEGQQLADLAVGFTASSRSPTKLRPLEKAARRVATGEGATARTVSPTELRDVAKLKTDSHPRRIEGLPFDPRVGTDSTPSENPAEEIREARKARPSPKGF